MSQAVFVAVALGSNLGDRHAHLAWAARQLETVLDDARMSPIVETAPVDVPDAQPPYLNAVVTGLTAHPPERLLQILMGLEGQRGRLRTSHRGARTLDLDLILYGDRVIDSAALTVPHPRFRNRRFVLEPLASLAPDVRDPVTGQTVTELLDTCTRQAGGPG